VGWGQWGTLWGSAMLPELVGHRSLTCRAGDESGTGERWPSMGCALGHGERTAELLLPWARRAPRGFMPGSCCSGCPGQGSQVRAWD